jgi:hypothetical protein
MRTDLHFEIPIEYHEDPFLLRREIKVGVNWGKDTMIEVYLTGVLPLPEQLNAALFLSKEIDEELKSASKDG